MINSRNAAFAEESAEVEVLFAEAAKFDGISKRIKASLARLESGAQTVKNSIGPVHSNTQSLQTMNSNIDGILASIEKMLLPSEDKGREETIIRAGPSKVGLSEYLASLKRVDRLLSQMTSTNLRVNQQAIGDFNELISTGSVQLQSLFRSVLGPNAQVVEPLHFITKQLPFPTISQEVMTHLRSIDAFLSSSVARDATNSHHESMSARIYAEIRGSYLSGSLQNLATASITTSTKKSAADEIYRQGTSGIGMYANGMEGIFLAEYQNITAIFAREEWAVVFENTCSKALMDFAQTVLELNRHIKSNMITDCFLAYEVMEIVSGVSSRLDSQTGELKSAFVDAMKPIRETAKSSIFDLIDDVRRRTQSIASLPGDAAALPYTTELMTRLQAFTPYQRSIGSILASIGDGNWKTGSVSATGSSTSLPSLKSFDVGADWNKLLAHYMLDTMETLLTTLESKARMLLKNRSVVGVFMANNVAVIDRMIRSSELSSVLSCDGAPAKIDSWGKKGTAAYLDGWRELCTILTDLNFSSRSIRPPSSSIDFHDSAAVLRGLAGKDRDMIKDKFKAFNTSFDELCSKHRTLTLEKEIRGPLITELKTIVEPAYSGFWKLFHAIDKGKAKYVKYDAGSLSAQLLRL